MMNKHLKHIAYYTKKVAQEGEKARPTYTGFRNSIRSKRLFLYKQLLNEMITTRK
ncbi:hypothetical protein QFZ31_002303 [Neobacillus niacini]|uniref:hypothetical protein n=1 Tax=Neobacillus driksii TaxID=3035913 RepID=UPI00278B7BBB|nr:hypothetical protein [Neobacillus niacini]MDQ0972425.1 hypothetical protein [Neobacillus niacini]